MGNWQTVLKGEHFMDSFFLLKPRVWLSRKGEEKILFSCYWVFFWSSVCILAQLAPIPFQDTISTSTNVCQPSSCARENQRTPACQTIAFVPSLAWFLCTRQSSLLCPAGSYVLSTCIRENKHMINQSWQPSTKHIRSRFDPSGHQRGSPMLLTQNVTLQEKEVGR